MDMSTLAQEFVVYLEAERGYSPLTASAYRSDLRQFVDFLSTQESVPDPTDLQPNHVREWVVDMRRRGLSPRSIARHLYALRSFWRYLLDIEAVSHDPLRRITAPKVPRRLPTYLNPVELQALLDAALRHPMAACAFRNFAILSVLIFTGMRRSELLELRLGDVDREAGVVLIRNGKGGRARSVPLVADAVQAVDDWLEFRPECGHDYLFATTHGNRIHATRLQIIWKRVLRDSGITRPGVSLHTLRHSAATLLLQNGVDLVSIQQILGHTRLDTTAVYLHTNTEDLRKGIGHHPLAIGEREREGPPRPAAVNSQCSVATGWRVRR